MEGMPNPLELNAMAVRINASGEQAVKQSKEELARSAAILGGSFQLVQCKVVTPNLERAVGHPLTGLHGLPLGLDIVFCKRNKSPSFLSFLCPIGRSVRYKTIFGLSCEAIQKACRGTIGVEDVDAMSIVYSAGL